MVTDTDAQTSGDAEATDLTASGYHRLLAVERRRVAIAVLADRRNPVELPVAAAEVAARENAPGPVDLQTVERVAASLHHQHLPMMADLGVVDYDREARRVEGRGPALDALADSTHL